MTVIVGALCLFLPLFGLARGLAPGPAALTYTLTDDLLAVISTHTSSRSWARLRRIGEALIATAFGPRARWFTILSAGALIGAGLATAELRNGTSAHIANRLFVAAVYVGLEATAVLIGFALLHRPLRLSSYHLPHRDAL